MFAHGRREPSNEPRHDVANHPRYRLLDPQSRIITFTCYCVTVASPRCNNNVGIHSPECENVCICPYTHTHTSFVFFYISLGAREKVGFPFSLSLQPSQPASSFILSAVACRREGGKFLFGWQSERLSVQSSDVITRIHRCARACFLLCAAALPVGRAQTPQVLLERYQLDLC